MPERLIHALIGAAAGLLSALFGVGGGTVIVPALVARGWDVKRAAATSLAAIGITASVGALLYGISGTVRWRDAALIGLPAVGGVLIGIVLQKRISGPRLQLGFALLMALIAIRLITDTGNPTAHGGPELAIVLGIAGGILSGLFGVGGGIIFVPALTLALGLTQIVAQATSLAAMVPVVAMGAYRQNRAGLVDWRNGILLGTAGTVGIYVGKEIATSLTNTTLRIAFGCFLLLSAAQLAQRARRSTRTG